MWWAWWLACSSGSSTVPDAGLQVAPERPEVVKPALRDPAFADARCNDGTPFAYTLRPGRPDRFVVNLAGGHFCDDERVRCADRRHRLTTTLPEADGAPRAMKHRGIFSPDPVENPSLHDATVVDAHYCSSDLWLGDRTERRPTTGDPERGWYFSGRTNLRALLGSLKAHAGLRDGEAEVLVLGTSAGGAGVVGNLDAIVTALPRTHAAGRLRVVLDGSWLPLQEDAAGLPNGAAWGPVHPDCPSRDCIFGERWWPHVQATGVPVLVQLSGLDRSQTAVFGVDTPEERAAWRARARESLEPLPWVFSGGHPYHVVAITPAFGKGPAGQTFREVLDRFRADAPPEQVFFRYSTPENAVNGGTPGR